MATIACSGSLRRWNGYLPPDFNTAANFGWVTSGGLGPTLRREVDPRHRTPPAARVASGSGHKRPLTDPFPTHEKLL